jgi:hypothetical protein
MVEIMLFHSDRSQRTIALLDSGADYSLFHIDFAKHLGFEITLVSKK